MDSRTLLVVLSAVAATAIAAVVVNLVDSVLLALAAFLLVPLLSGSYAGIMAIPGKAALLLVPLAIAAFFVAGAIVSSGDPDTTLAEEVAVYLGVGGAMTLFGYICYGGMRLAGAASEARTANQQDDGD